ncbi:MAG TPA: 16S rRNA (cytosine(1402)-N(4))-methyltransferase RsmH [Patescibacteria group bacterium]|nr:16S rRNA (cytosine(1402)-N(4))-methyltransferase RsmH [Patescibacteria group bacterium]
MDHVQHIPVLLEEVRHYIHAESGGVYVDGTLGHGGHTEAMLNDSAPDGKVVGIELDSRNMKIAKKRLQSFGDRVLFVQGSYSDLAQHLDDLGIEKVDGILLDVGFSSSHVDDPTRGFSFMKEGPLDMRYDFDQELTAAEVVNSWSEGELAEAFLLYGEEKQAPKIARLIVQRRREKIFRTTTDLSETIASAIGRHGRIHPATRVFQALRIVVNDELGSLKAVLPQAESVLKEGGRLCVISFHSLEDRIVKKFLRRSSDLQVVTKKPVTPLEAEQKTNPRARSAKFRVAIKQKSNDNQEQKKT